MAKLNFSIALGLAAQKFTKGINDVQTQLGKFSSSLKGIGGMIAGAFAVGKIKSFAQECTAAYAVQAQAEQKLATVMQQRMGASAAEIDSVKKLTAAQQELGVIGDEVQLAGAQQVSTFLTQKSSLETLLPAMNNLLAQQRGLSASTGDAVNIGNLMGKVMQGQTGALKRVGISFSEAEEKVLKYGTESEKAAMLAKVITNNVGEMNAALATTDSGRQQQLANTLGDLKENIGKALMPLLGQLAPIIQDFAVTGANSITAFLKSIQGKFREVASVIIGVFAGIKLVPMVQSWFASFQASQQQTVAAARVATAQREALERSLVAKKNALAVQEATIAETEGAKRLAMEQRAAATRAAIIETETALVKAKNAEQTASTAATAAANTTLWTASWNGVKAAGVACWMTIKGVMISTGIGAIIAALTWAVTALGEKFKLGEKLGKVWNKLTGSSGTPKKDKPKAAAVKATGTHTATPTAATAKIPKTPKTKADKAKTPAEQAKEDTAAALKDYARTVKVAQNDMLTGVKNATEARQDVLGAMQSLYDAYAKAYADTGREEYRKKMGDLANALTPLKSALEAEKEAAEYAASKDKERADALAAFRKDSKAVADKYSGGRDKTFDYKSKGSETIKADLEFNLEKAKAQLDVLKTAAEDGIAEAQQKLAGATAEVSSLEDALKLQQVSDDLEAMRKELKGEWVDLAKSGWDGLKNTVSDIGGMVDTLGDPDASGWEKFCSVIDTLIGVFQTLQGIMETINTIQAISTALKKADTTATATQTAVTAANTAATTTAAATNVAASTAQTAASGGEAIAGATASGAKMPFPYNLIAIALGVAAVAAALATAFSKGGVVGGYAKGGIIPRFAGGGMFAGSSLNGDTQLARVNSGEMILNGTQQRRLFDMLGIGQTQGKQMSIVGRVSGRDIELSLANTTRLGSRSGRKSNIKV